MIKLFSSIFKTQYSLSFVTIPNTQIICEVHLHCLHRVSFVARLYASAHTDYFVHFVKERLPFGSAELVVRRGAHSTAPHLVVNRSFQLFSLSYSRLTQTTDLPTSPPLSLSRQQGRAFYSALHRCQQAFASICCIAVLTAPADVLSGTGRRPGRAL